MLKPFVTATEAWKAWHLCLMMKRLAVWAQWRSTRGNHAEQPFLPVSWMMSYETQHYYSSLHN